VGEGEDLPLGTPCFVFVEEEDDIAAFANYVAEAGAPPPPSRPPRSLLPPSPLTAIARTKRHALGFRQHMIRTKRTGAVV
jgi:hypothetical protein